MSETIELNDAALSRLAAVSEFELPAEGCVLFGIRGALPDPEEERPAMADAVRLRLTELDYDHPRCAIGQWDRTRHRLRAFAGSTVPHINLVRRGMHAGGAGVNQMLEGCATYRRGLHTPGPGREYPAFRQAAAIGYQRTSGDAVYNRADAIHYSLGREDPGDNIHAAFTARSTFPYKDASAGCQTVVGMAKRPGVPNSRDSGGWPDFRDLAYATGQDVFRYMLLGARFVRDVLAAPVGTFPVHVRMGSFGPAVRLLQQALLEARYEKTTGERYITDPAHVDADFGPRTLRSLVDCQRSRGLLEDGVAGPVTAAALQIADWPKA